MILRARSEDGLELVADILGQAVAPVVLLMHGGGQTRHSWGGAAPPWRLPATGR